MKKSCLLKTAAVLAMFTAVSAFSQSLNSGTSSATDVTLTATVAESLTVSLDQNAVNFTLTPGSATNAGDKTVNATTTWSLAPGRTAVTLYAYFDTPAQALANGSNYIPAANISAAVGGSTIGALTGSFGSGTAIMTQAITSANYSGTKASAVTLNIDLSGTPTMAAGAYTGTLHFQAQATT